MRVALVQVASPPAEPAESRRRRVEAMLSDAAGADLVVLPELWVSGYFAFDDYERLAEPFEGDTMAAAAGWARALGCYLHLGSFVERATDGGLHNTAVLMDPNGAPVHVYRKMHVFGYKSREAALLTAGDEIAVTETTLSVFASTTCYDLRFPELYRALIDAGAKTIIVPAAWPAARRSQWQLFSAVRAAEEQVLVIACNAVGEQFGVQVGGYSRIVDPWGNVLVEAGTDEGVTFCDIDPGIVDSAREEFPVLADRRIPFPDMPATQQRKDPS